MKNLFFFYLLATTLYLSSCKVEPKTINYGTDHCHYCDMTIIDKTHSSEYVTNKGKAFVFDAIECMINEINQNSNEDNLEILLVANYLKPGELINAKNAGFLISKEIRSPMGANLSAFENIDEANNMQSKNGGEVYSWSGLIKKFQK